MILEEWAKATFLFMERDLQMDSPYQLIPEMSSMTKQNLQENIVYGFYQLIHSCFSCWLKITKCFRLKPIILPR